MTLATFFARLAAAGIESTRTGCAMRCGWQPRRTKSCWGASLLSSRSLNQHRYPIREHRVPQARYPNQGSCPNCNQIMTNGGRCDGLLPLELSGRLVRPVSLPAGRALPDRLHITRALRPFRQSWLDQVPGTLDEERTADTAAEPKGLVWPRFQPRRERWDEAELVLEDDPAIAVWSDVVADLAQVMRDSGAFRDVRTWRLRDTAAKAPVLESRNGRRVASRTLGDGSVRRLVLFITHGAALFWADGSYARVLAHWRPRASVAIVQAMPRHQWRRTMLGEPQGVCRAIACGVPTAELSPERDWWTHLGHDGGAAFAVPLVALSAGSLAGFAKAQMGRKREMDAVFVDPTPPAFAAPSRPAATRNRTEATLALLQAESPQAFQVATYLSAAPFTLPVARLVQETKFGRNADPSCLGELLLGGLVESRATNSDDTALAEFEFRGEARTILQRSMRPRERVRLRNALIGHVSDHLAAIKGRTSRVRAFTPDEAGTLHLPNWAQPFARMADALAGSPSRVEGIVPSARVAFMGETQPETAILLGQALIDAGCTLVSSGTWRHGGGDRKGV